MRDIGYSFKIALADISCIVNLGISYMPEWRMFE